MFSCFSRNKPNNVIIVLHNTTTLFNSSEHIGFAVDRLSKQEFQTRLAEKNIEAKEALQSKLENTQGTPEFFKKQKAQRKLDKKIQAQPNYHHIKNPLTHV